MSTRQRSFRLREGTLRLLDARSRDIGHSSNALAQRLIDEALHREGHSLIVFRDAGQMRRAALVGTRLYVWQVMETLRTSGNDVPDAAEYLDLTRAQVEACASYYAEFQEEIDADTRAEGELAERERARWMRLQEVLGAAAAG
jgi:uncharacterized protein (DUF433 family)